MSYEQMVREFMNIRYEITDQLTGLPQSAGSFAEAKILQKELLDKYIAHISPCFSITALVENEDGSVTQVGVDTEGNPVIPE